MPGAIDILCNHFTQESIDKNFLQNEEELDRFEAVGRMHNLVGREPGELLAELSEVGVDKLLVTAIKVWSYRRQCKDVWTETEEVVELTTAHPDRIFGLFGVNPHQGMDGVRELEHAVKEHGFRGIHIHPHGYDMPPDHAYYFPYYAKCEELGVPAVLSMGHTLDFLPIDAGRPIHLDKVALYFPNLNIVCTHTGWPWVEEAIALAHKHPNYYIGTSAYAPKYWRPEMVRFINGRGKDKVMWGTDFPLVLHEESLRQIDELGLKEENKQALLHGNATRVFGFDP
ncbi:MAG: amidohydrolase [Thiotrichales bacterium]|nr:amidohydrolase [Thiotrichales bacterium]|tara:strand:+ start:247 stop:1098 length:852 start_codon:yes stop_codon:yes gene_type:complete